MGSNTKGERSITNEIGLHTCGDEAQAHQAARQPKAVGGRRYLGLAAPPSTASQAHLTHGGSINAQKGDLW